MTDQIQITRNDLKGQYDITVDGTVAGRTEFQADAEGRLVFDHTEIDPAFGGRGLGASLVGAAMSDVAARGETVVPVCSFVVKYLQTHEVPGLSIHWRERDVETAEQSTAAEKMPADEGVGRE